MFFRRQRPHNPTFQDRLAALRQAGFSITPQTSGAFRVSRDSCAAMLEERDGQTRLAGRAGIVMGDEIGVLVDAGFQKFFQTSSGKKKPATAEELKAIYNFEEDLKEALGMVSLYNESLGTVSTYYQYDRVQGRDRGVPKRAWEQ